MKQALINRGYVGEVGNPFIELDREKLASRLRLEERGRENGEQDIPAPHANIFDSAESDIVVEISNYATRAHNEATSQLSSYNARVGQLDKLAQVSTVSGTARAAVGDLNVAVRGWNDILFGLRNEVASSFREMETFRLVHNITRPAHDALPATATWGALFVAWIIEVAANTLFLWVNNDLGVLGGAIAAMLVASVNLFVLGSLAGIYFWRSLQHQAVWRRGLGAIGTAFWASAVVIWNIFAAHYRDATGAMHSAPDHEAIRLTLTTPFAFEGIQTIGFLAAGIVFSIFAAQRFYKMDDPYPGYGEIWRRHQARIKTYSDDAATARDELQEIRDKAVNSATTLRSELSAQLAQLSQIQIGRSAFLRNYEVHIDRLEHEGNALLAKYRLANQRARHLPVPQHFQVNWQLSRYNLAEDLPAAAMPIDLSEKVAAAQRDLEKAVVEINDAFDATQGQFAALADLELPASHG